MAVIHLTSQKVEQTYKRQFEEKFNAEVTYLETAREKRTASQIELGRKLAESEFVVNRLLSGKSDEDKGDARRKFLDSVPTFPVPGQQGGRPGVGKGPKNPLQKVNRILAVMDMNGEVSFLTNPLEKFSGRSSNRNNRGSVQRRLQMLSQDSESQIAYIPQKVPGGGDIIREIGITPVKHPDSGAVIGAFLMSLSAAETGAQRFLDRYHREVTEGHFENAIFLEDVLYPSEMLGSGHSKTREIPDFDELESAVREAITNLPVGQYEGDFEISIHGDPHFVHYCALNEESPLSTAWQISAFPLFALKKDLNDLRIKGSGIGIIGILMGLVASFFLSKKIAVPIRELSQGTHKIGEGNFDMQLPVHSHDEIGELTESFNKMAGELRQKELYRTLLEKVSDESVAQAMIEGTLNPRLGGEIKTVTVLFCDIRGFTALTEDMRPEDVIEILNVHMTAMTRVVREHFGVVDKFVGDEIMAVFGGLKSYGNDAVNAAHCAVKMMEERKRLNIETGTEISIGIGLATGEIVAGCMGSEDRLNYTVLGARVNLGARLCGRAGPGEIVIDDQTFAEIADSQPVTEPIEGLLLKGFRSAVPAWKLSHAGIRKEFAAGVTVG